MFVIIKRMSIKFIQQVKPHIYAEIGVFKGDTVLKVCDHLEKGSHIYLFDYKHKVDDVTSKIKNKYGDKFTIHSHGVVKGDYNWDLIKLIKTIDEKFDYVYIDGAHDLTIDGLAFFIVDYLLKPEGYIEFDDYNWNFGMSTVPNTIKIRKEKYTSEQMRTPHVKLIVDNLVETNPKYKSIKPKRIYQKIK